MCTKCVEFSGHNLFTREINKNIQGTTITQSSVYWLKYITMLKVLRMYQQFVETNHT